MKVSTIMPAYNGELYIQGAIESVLSQTYKDIELIVVDDASTDRTGEIVKSFSSKLKYIRHNNNMGPSAARNTAIEQAKGEYIAFLDQDDLWMPTKLEEQIKLLKSNEDVALVYSNCYKIDSLGLEMGTLFDSVKPHRGFVFERLLLGNFIPTPSIVVKKQVLDEVGGFNERFLTAMDFELSLRIAERHKIDFVDLPLLKYRVHPGSVSHKKRKLMLEEGISITKFYRDRVGFNNPHFAQKLDKRIAKYMFYLAIWSLNHRNRLEALRRYFDCIKTGAFDCKIVLGFIFFIMPNFISAPLLKNLIKINSS